MSFFPPNMVTKTYVNVTHLKFLLRVRVFLTSPTCYVSHQQCMSLWFLLSVFVCSNPYVAILDIFHCLMMLSISHVL